MLAKPAWGAGGFTPLHGTLLRPVFVISNLNVDNIVFFAFLIMQRWCKGNFPALEEVNGEEYLVVTN